MKVKVYANFGEQLVISTKKFEEYKEDCIRDYADDNYEFREWLNKKYYASDI